MGCMTKAIAMTLSAGLAVSAASAQVEFTLIHTENVDVLSATNEGGDPMNPFNAFFIGSNPVTVVLQGDNLFIGGFRNSSPDPAINQVQIIRISNIFLENGPQRLFWFVPNSVKANPTLFRGYVGMDYYPGTDFGLLASSDVTEVVGDPNQVQRWDIDTQQNPILLAPDEFLLPPQRRGAGGVSWDFGPDADSSGLGDGIDSYDFGLGPDGVIDADAVVAILDGGDDSLGNDFLLGPYGYDKDVLDMGFGNNLYNAVDGMGPRLWPVRDSVLWQDLNIDPRGGLLAGRADNDLVLATRVPDQNPGDSTFFSAGEVTNQQRVDEGNFQTVGQHVEILHGICEDQGDLVVYNSRTSTSTGQAWLDVVKYVDFNGVAQSPTFVNPDSSPVDFSESLTDDFLNNPQILTGNGIYDFFWEPETQRLAVLDFTNRNVHIFEVTCGSGPTPCSPADVTTDGSANGIPDGVVTLSDFSFYLALWGSGDLAADVTTDGTANGVPDGAVTLSDFSFYLALWGAGCP